MPSTVTIAPVVRESEKKRDDTYPVRIRVTFKRQQKVLSTNFAVEKHQLSRSFEIKDPAVAEAVASVVRSMRAAVNGLDPFKLEDMDVKQVAAYIEKELAGGDASFSLDFPTYFEKIAGEKNKTGRANFMSALHSLSTFLGTDRFDISVISSSMMRKYERWLREKHGDSARAVSHYTKTIAYVHRRAREEYNNEESDQVLIRNPFEYYKCPRQPASRHRNVDAQIVVEMLGRRGELSGLERLGVDLFLISFALMGMNTPDIYDCAKPKDGVITYNRTKTRDRRSDRAEMRVRIEPCVQQLLSEYGDPKRAFCFHARYSEYQSLARAANNGLKRFAERIGVPAMTLYSARHTWSTIARSLRIEKATVDECLCHVDESMRMADVYIAKDWTILWEANAKVLALFGWPGQAQNESS